MRLHHYLLFLATTAFACQPADTSGSAKQAIDAANAQWPRLTSTGHADSIAEFYAADAVHGAGDMAMERGSWHWAFPAGAKLPPGMPAVDSGKYIVHWMQQNGKWLMVDDIWNSDTPLPSAPPPPPAPARRGR